MKINPDDPWYPTPWSVLHGHEHGAQITIPSGYPGVTIRLKLAAVVMQGWLTTFRSVDSIAAMRCDAPSLADWAYEIADAMIARANRDEGSDDDK